MSESGTQPGDVLRDAREAMNVSIREVADALNLQTRVVEAIEANDFSNIQPTFARGYIRTYAKLFELEADPLVTQFEELVGDPTLTAPVVERSQTISITLLQTDKIKMIVIAAVVVVVFILIIVVFSFWPSSDAAEQTSANSGEVTADTQLPSITVSETGSVAESALPQNPNSPGTLATQEAPSEQSPEDPQVLFQEMDTALDNPTSPALVASSTPALNPTLTATGRRITAEGDNVLHFEFSEDCWVQVNTPEGGNLYSDLSRSGSSLDLVGQGPFRILLGYAPGVFLEYNQSQVALKPHTRNNVASFVLGQ